MGNACGRAHGIDSTAGILEKAYTLRPTKNGGVVFSRNSNENAPALLRAQLLAIWVEGYHRV